MARTDNLRNFLTDVADAIRTKTGGTEQIPASQFDTEIEKLGGITPNGIIESYYAYAGENISAGDFVEFINGVASSKDYGNSSLIQFHKNSSSSLYSQMGAVALDDGRIFVALEDADNKLYGLILTIENGINISASATTLLSSGSSSGKGEMTPILLSNNRVIVFHSYGSSFHLYASLCDVSGEAISLISDTKIVATTRAGFITRCSELSDDTICVAHSKTSNYNLYAIVCRVENDNTITIGTDLALSTEDDSGKFITNTVIDNSRVLITGDVAYVCTVEGTTISLASSVDLGINADIFLSAVPLPGEQVLFIHSLGTNSTNLGFILAQLSGTNVSVSSILDTEYQLGSHSNGAHCSPFIPIINGKLFIAYVGEDEYLNVAICTVENDVISVLSNTVLNTTYEVSNGEYLWAIPLQNGSIITLYHYKGTASSNKYAQIYVLDGNEVSNHIIIPDIEKQVKKSISLPFDGIAKTGGTGGDKTGHKDMVQIFTVGDVNE